MSLWGLDVLDGNKDSKYTYGYSGKGPVNVYLLDSGVELGHPDFKPGQVSSMYNVTGTNLSATRDCTGHGSYVSGIIAGKLTGVAKDAQIHMLRVSDCGNTFSTANLVDALTFLKTRIQKPAVVQVSLLYASSTSSDVGTLSTLISEYINDLQVPVVIPAGDSSISRCNAFSNIQGLFTVGAHDEQFNQASFSNYGECTNVYSPGVNIWSHSNATQGKLYSVHSGTSTAASFMTAVIATILERNPSSTPQDIRDAFEKRSSRFVTDKSGAQKPLLGAISTESSGSSQNPLLTLPFIIGIAVGAVVLVLLVLGALYFFLRKKKERNILPTQPYAPSLRGRSIRFSNDGRSYISEGDEDDNAVLGTLRTDYTQSSGSRQTKYGQYHVDERYINPKKHQAVSVYSTMSYYPNR